MKATSVSVRLWIFLFAFKIPKSDLGRQGRKVRGKEGQGLGLRARKREEGFCLFMFYFPFFYSKAIFKTIFKNHFELLLNFSKTTQYNK